MPYFRCGGGGSGSNFSATLTVTASATTGGSKITATNLAGDVYTGNVAASAKSGTVELKSSGTYTVVVEDLTSGSTKSKTGTIQAIDSGVALAITLAYEFVLPLTDLAGWTKTYTSASQPASMNVNDAGTGVYYSTGGNNSHRWYITEKIDLTGYTTFTYDIVRKYSNAAQIGFTKTQPAASVGWDFSKEIAVGTNQTIDVSDAEGEYWFMVSGYGNSYEVANAVLS